MSLNCQRVLGRGFHRRVIVLPRLGKLEQVKEFDGLRLAVSEKEQVGRCKSKVLRFQLWLCIIPRLFGVLC